MGVNDEKYITRIKKFAKNFKSDPAARMTTYCSSNGDDSTYGFYNDPEDFIVEGSYVEAGNATIEANLASCSSVDSLVIDAEAYLTSEGFSDIVADLYRHRERCIHAANALLDMKLQVEENWLRSKNNYTSGDISSARTAQFAGCVLQALGYTALAELGGNWATKSRQAILKAIGKLASRYLNWFGAVIAVVSFVDCMWG